MSAKELAQTAAFQAIAFIVGQEEVLRAFLATSGLTLPDLKNALQRDETLAASLDWLLENEKYLMSFCHQHEMTPKNIWSVRNQLPGALAQQHQSI